MKKLISVFLSLLLIIASVNCLADVEPKVVGKCDSCGSTNTKLTSTDIGYDIQTKDGMYREVTIFEEYWHCNNCGNNFWKFRYSYGPWRPDNG